MQVHTAPLRTAAASATWEARVAGTARVAAAREWEGDGK